MQFYFYIFVRCVRQYFLIYFLFGDAILFFCYIISYICKVKWQLKQNISKVYPNLLFSFSLYSSYNKKKSILKLKVMKYITFFLILISHQWILLILKGSGNHNDQYSFDIKLSSVNFSHMFHLGLARHFPLHHIMVHNAYPHTIYLEIFPQYKFCAYDIFSKLWNIYSDLILCSENIKYNKNICINK